MLDRYILLASPRTSQPRRVSLLFHNVLGHIHWEARDTARHFFEQCKVIDLFMLPDGKIAQLREMLLELGIPELDERVLDPLIEEHLQFRFAASVVVAMC